MATEQEKMMNLTRVIGMLALGQQIALWNMVGESTYTLVAPIGEEMLKMFEKGMGLQLAGETPEAVLNELGRLFMDELGFVTEWNVERKDNCIFVTRKSVPGARDFILQLKAAGVEKNYGAPDFLCSMAALKRMGVKARGDVMDSTDGLTSTYTIRLL